MLYTPDVKATQQSTQMSGPGSDESFTETVSVLDPVVKAQPDQRAKVSIFIIIKVSASTCYQAHPEYRC